MLVIWLAAWQMPTLTGNGPQELFVSIQDHLLDVKLVAFLAIALRVAPSKRPQSVQFTARSAESKPAPSRERPRPLVAASSGPSAARSP